MRLDTVLAPLCLLSLVSQSALGAGVVLRSDIFLKLCKIEISKGTDASGIKNRTVFSGPVEKGWSYEIHDADYLCYRRSSDPLDCGSKLTAHRCLSWSADGQIAMPLQ